MEKNYFDLRKFSLFHSVSCSPEGQSATLSKIVKLQGLAVFNDVWYFLANVNEDTDKLFLYSEKVGIISFQSHYRNFGMSAIFNESIIVTVGVDAIQTNERRTMVVIKIWAIKDIACKDYKPRSIILADSSREITSMAVAKNLRAIAIGFNTGNTILVHTPLDSTKNLLSISDNEILFMRLIPEKKFISPVTNIHIVEYEDTKQRFYYTHCACEKGIYFYNKQNFQIISQDYCIQSSQMCGKGEKIFILDKDTKQILEFVGKQAKKLADINFISNEIRKIKLFDNNILLIGNKENENRIVILDYQNNTITYEEEIKGNLLGEFVENNRYYFFIKNSDTVILQTLQEFTNNEKILALMKNKSDIAYTLAQNLNFPQEDLANIAKSMGEREYNNVT